MNNRLQPLEARLRDEARKIRQKNGFSPILHERLMASLRCHGLAPTPLRAEGRPTLWRWIGPLAAAAAVALAAWLILRPSPPGPVPPQQAKRDIPELPTVEIAARVDPATSALEERKFAYLDRDAQTLITFVADQLPDVPQPQAPK